jgi:heptosyltransferase-1
MVSALARKSAHGAVTGLANATLHSGYEPMARRFYDESVQVPLKCHAIDRSRWVMCSAMDWPLFDRRSEPPRFYPNEKIEGFSPLILEGMRLQPNGKPAPYILCFHATARAAKRWPDADWVTLGRALSTQGYQLIFPWGSPDEMKTSAHLASQIPGAIVPRAFSIEEAYHLIAHTVLTIGVDTGLTHLSAVLGKPTIEIYCDSPRWKTEGYWSKLVTNLGDMKTPPSVGEVLQAIQLVSR